MRILQNPLVYEINTATFLHDRGTEIGHPATLSDITDAYWDGLAAQGIDAVWLMGVWERSPVAIAINLQDEEFMSFLRTVLPDLTADDIIGSAYSIRDYHVGSAWGGDAAMMALRHKLNARGLGLILDFVPNHTSLDHPWVSDHPDYYVLGSPEDLEREPDAYVKLHGRIYAKGRDPTFPAWSDVLQLNAFSTHYRHAAKDLLSRLGDLCDGLRCDMAMLMTNEIFATTWGERAGTPPHLEFWTENVNEARKTHPDLLLLAETYWDTEATLLGQGFDCVYDKKLYDSLVEEPASAVCARLKALEPLQGKLAHFIENHDEPRAAATFPEAKARAAATALLTLPGLRLLHDGQADGLGTRVPVQLRRGPAEVPHTELRAFYEDLLETVKSWNLAQGTWQLIAADNPDILAWRWTAGDRHLVVINYSDQPCHASIEDTEYDREAWESRLIKSEPA